MHLLEFLFNQGEHPKRRQAPPPGPTRIFGGGGQRQAPNQDQKKTGKSILRGFGVAVGPAVRPWAQLRQERAPYILPEGRGRRLPPNVQVGQGGATLTRNKFQWARAEAALTRKNFQWARAEGVIIGRGQGGGRWKRIFAPRGCHRLNDFQPRHIFTPLAIKEPVRRHCSAAFHVERGSSPARAGYLIAQGGITK